MSINLKVINDTPLLVPRHWASRGNKFKKILRDKSGHCWYCHNKTEYALYFRDGSEIFACVSCLHTQGKIPRLTRKYMFKGKSLTFQESAILNHNSHIVQSKLLIVEARQ